MQEQAGISHKLLELEPRIDSGSRLTESGRQQFAARPPYFPAWLNPMALANAWLGRTRATELPDPRTLALREAALNTHHPEPVSCARHHQQTGGVAETEPLNQPATLTQDTGDRSQSLTGTGGPPGEK